VTVIVYKNNPEIPENEKAIICSDLREAIFLGVKSKMVVEAFQQFCGTKSSQ